MPKRSTNLIPNANFKMGRSGNLPEQWSLFIAQPYLSPNFQLVDMEGSQVLSISGNGNENCMGWLTTSFPMEGGETYRMHVHFRATEDINPYKNLLFSFWVDKNFNDGVFDFHHIGEGEFEGEGKFPVPGHGPITGEVRIAFRLSEAGTVWIHQISLEQSEPIPERNVRIACVRGFTDELDLWEKVIDAAAQNKADLMLLPETFTGYNPHAAEDIDGACASLMERKAKQHHMYMSGTFIHRDKADGHLYNTGLLFDREGKRIGRYDKFHPYSPEFLRDGISPGNDVPVFKTDFGTIGMMICYDSWFTDVAELLALKGAEIILFPNAGYYRSLMPARANDNGVRIVCSSMSYPLGVWDTSGGDVEAPNLDPSRGSNNDRTFRDVFKEQIGEIELMVVTMDLNQSPSAANWGGPMMSAPGSRRNRREQKNLLFDEIKAEVNRRSFR